jgi:hypothetical protein
MEDVAPIEYNEGMGLVTLMRDDFYVDGEFSKWFVPPGLPDPIVEGGLCELHESGIQGILFNDGGSGLWTEYTTKARIRGTNDPSYSGFGIAAYGDVATINGYASLVDLNTGYSNLVSLTFGSGSPIESVLLADKGII